MTAPLELLRFKPASGYRCAICREPITDNELPEAHIFGAQYVQTTHPGCCPVCNEGTR